MPETSTDFSSFAGMLKAALGPLVDQAAETFLDMMAPAGVMEFPYAPPGAVRRLDGREALAAYLSDLGDVLAIDSMTDPTVHRTIDPAVVIIEFGCTGRGLKTGLPYNQRYISVITIRSGKIVRYVDYWNPLVLLETLGDIETPATAMGKGR